MNAKLFHDRTAGLKQLSVTALSFHRKPFTSLSKHPPAGQLAAYSVHSFTIH